MEAELETPAGAPEQVAEDEPAKAKKSKKRKKAKKSEAPPVSALNHMTRRTRMLLLAWLAITAAIALALAMWNASLTQSSWDLVGTALLLGIGVTCVLATGAVIRNSHSAALVALASQIFVVCLAGYFWMVDLRSPFGQMRGVTGVALAVGAIALCWVVYLSRYAVGALSKAGVVVVALFPLAGLGQFWIQNQFLPNSSIPLVDVTTELVALGSTGPIIHLQATTTLHNRGSFQVDVAAGLTRIVTYPKTTLHEPATPENVASHLNPVGSQISSYREIPISPAEARLVFARAGTLGGYLPPGSTSTTTAVIDIDSRDVRLVSLDSTVVAITHRSVRDTRTCYPPQRSLTQDPEGFFGESMETHDFVDGKTLCVELQLASRGAVEELVFDNPLLRVYTMVQAPPGMVAPFLIPFFGTQESLDDPMSALGSSTRIENANPSSVLGSSAEYAPSDADITAGG